MKAPVHAAAWINVIGVGGNFREAMAALQETWNDYMKLREDYKILKQENYDLRNRRD